MLNRRETLVCLFGAAIVMAATPELSEQARIQKLAARFDALMRSLTQVERERIIEQMEWLSDNPHVSREEIERRMHGVFD